MKRYLLMKSLGFLPATAAIVAAVALILAPTPPVFSQWGPGGCYTPLTSPVGLTFVNPNTAHFSTPTAAAFTGWKSADRGWYTLWDRGTQLGAWHPAIGYRQKLPGGAWGEPTDPPVTPPILAPEQAPEQSPIQPPRKPLIEAPSPELNFGLDLDKIAEECPTNGKPRYKINERNVTSKDIIQALAQQSTSDGRVVDDSKKRRLVIIGSEAARNLVLADIKASQTLADLLKEIVVYDYTPDHWHLRPGFKTAATDATQPVIYLADAKGEVIHRQDDYKDGAKGLQIALQKAALRKTDPNYDPKKDPDLRKPDAGPHNPGGSPVIDLKALNHPIVWLLLGAGGLWGWNRWQAAEAEKRMKEGAK